MADHRQQQAAASVAAMRDMPAVRQARAVAGHLFQIAHGASPPAEAAPSFEAAIDEYVTNYLYKAVASDPILPRFVTDFLPPHHIEGQSSGGARMGGDNPDNHYRLAGIAHGGRYRVTGRFGARRAAHFSITLTGNWATSVTIAGLDGAQIETDADGAFELTIDAEPANGRPNHLTTQPHAKFLFVRDSMADWNAERPCALNIERLDRPGTPAPTLEKLAQEAAFRLVEDVPLTYWFHRMLSSSVPGQMAAPNASSALGGLTTQANSRGWFQLAEDQVVLIRYRQAGAAYAALQLTDWWFRSIDAHRRPSSLTHAQAVAGEDGWIECVLAREDPGVVNWLDTGGLSTLLLLARWQGLPSTGEPPAIEAKVMTVAELRNGAVWAGGPISPAGRAAALAERAAGWNGRFGESYNFG